MRRSTDGHKAGPAFPALRRSPAPACGCPVPVATIIHWMTRTGAVSAVAAMTARTKRVSLAMAVLAAMTTLPVTSPAAVAESGLLDLLVAVPGGIKAVDLNADGRLDIVATDFGTDALTVRLNDGRGSFGPLARYAVGVKPSFVASGDFDRDGAADIAVSNAGSADVSVLLGVGNGTLRPARSYAVSGPSAGLLGVSTGTSSLEAADVDGDGIQDLVTSNLVSNDVSVLRGRGDGTFRAARTYPIPGASSIGGIPFALALGDFDGDGHADIVTGGANSVVIMRNDGSGGFSTTRSYAVGTINACAKVGDVDSDGLLDVVVTSWGGSNAQVLLGNGDGSFDIGHNASSGGLVAECFSLGDLNDDGRLDLAVANSSSSAGVGNVAVLIGDGTGHFGGEAVSATYPVNVAPWATALADVDLDGAVDIMVVNTFPPSVSLLHGNGDGTFRPGVSLPV